MRIKPRAFPFSTTLNSGLRTNSWVLSILGWIPGPCPESETQGPAAALLFRQNPAQCQYGLARDLPFPAALPPSLPCSSPCFSSSIKASASTRLSWQGAECSWRKVRQSETFGFPCDPVLLGSKMVHMQHQRKVDSIQVLGQKLVCGGLGMSNHSLLEHMQDLSCHSCLLYRMFSP